MNGKPAASEPERQNSALLKALGNPVAELNVADVGCGAGARCLFWASQGHQLYGADLSVHSIALARHHARERGLEILLDVASASALPWPDRSMDICIVCDALEHTPDWRRCIAECLRVLRPRGVLYIGSADCPSVRHMLRRELARHGVRGQDRFELAMPGPLFAPVRWLAQASIPTRGLLAFKPAA